MVVAFANNQTLVLVGTAGTTISTDPVPMGNNDRLSCISNVHSLGQTGGAVQVVYTAQVSNDGGQTWISTTITDTLNVVGGRRFVGLANGALVRFLFVISNPTGGGTDVSFMTFDLHVNMVHA